MVCVAEIPPATEGEVELFRASLEEKEGWVLQEGDRTHSGAEHIGTM